MEERVWTVGDEEEGFPLNDEAFEEAEAAVLRVDGGPEAEDLRFERLYRYVGCNSFCEHVEIDECAMLRITLFDDAWRRSVTDDETRFSEENCRCRNVGEIKEALTFGDFGLGFADLRFTKGRARIFGHLLEVTLYEVSGGTLTLERDQVAGAQRFELRVDSLEGIWSGGRS